MPNCWVLDANILFSDWARALVGELAHRQKAKLVWSELIEDEAFRNLVRLGRLHPQDAERQRTLLALTYAAECVPLANPAYFADLKAVDEKDRHVAALALDKVHTHEQPVALLTWNIRDFPRKPLLKHHIVRYTPEELILQMAAELPDPCNPLFTQSWLYEVLSKSIQRVQQSHASHPLQHPTAFVEKARPWPTAPLEWLDFLERNRMYQVAKILRNQP